MKAHPATPYQELNDVLRTLVRSAQEILDDNFLGAYLQGSFAVGDFDPHSDADFIVVMGRDLTGDEVEALQVMHDRIYSLGPEWAKHLEGSYFPEEILRDLARVDEKLWYLDHGARALIESPHCNTLVVRWIVRERGVVLGGPPPRSLIAPIPVEALRGEILRTIIDWGREIAAHPERYDNCFNELLFRRRLRSAERLSERAMLRGSSLENTPRSRSSALLVSVTRRDQRFRLGVTMRIIPLLL